MHLVAEDTQARIGYGLHADLYEHDVQESDSVRQNAWIGYQREIVENLAVSFQFADEYIYIGGSDFSNALLLEPSVYWRFAEWGAIKVDHKIGFVEFESPVIAPAVDRDGTFHDLGVMAYFDVPCPIGKLHC